MLEKRRLISIFLLYMTIEANGQRLAEKMYSNLDGTACFRRLNGTHTIGCSSTFRGSIGVLHLVNSENDLSFLLNDPPAPPYTAILPPRLFTRSIVMQLKEKGGPDNLINGILLINDRTGLQEFSPESKCPNEWSVTTSSQSCTAHNDTTFNPFGTDLINEFYPFPIYYIDRQEEIDKLKDCYHKFNSFDLMEQHTRPLCSVQIKSLMSGAGNARVCMNRSKNNAGLNLANTHYCDSLQGLNVFATLFERPVVQERKIDLAEKIILLTSRIDTVSMFDGFTFGAMDSLVSSVTLLAVAQFLNVVLPKSLEKKNKNILFVLFNGESLDFIGSQRFLYDLNNNLFPDSSYKRNVLKLENIEILIDLGTLDDPKNVKLYHPEDSSYVSKILLDLNNYSQNHKLNIDVSDAKTNVLPPFSAQTFWRENVSFPSLILTSLPKNRFFHSIFDDATNLNFTYMNKSIDFMKLEPLNNENEDTIQYKIRNFATILGMTLYSLSTGKSFNESMGVNVAFVDETLYCFLISSNCSFFKRIKQTVIEAPDTPPTRYIGVNTNRIGTAWIFDALGFVLGKKTNITEENCNYLPYLWYNGTDEGGDCLLTTHNYSIAQSPAFLDENYDWKSYKYSTWTESTWSEISARIFVQPSRTHSVLTLAIGIIVFVISLILVYLIRSKADVLFIIDSVSTTPISPPANC